jgi:putative colanic acid biosynthesis glycosyltransferase
MRILQINVVYQIGSTGKIVFEIHKQLQESGYESFVIHGRGKKTPELNVFKTSPEWEGKLQALNGRITGNFNGGSFYSTLNLISKIKEIAPDVVHVHLLNGNYVNNYKLLTYLAKNGYKTIITLHAEITYTGICEHAFDCERWKSGCGHCPQIFNRYKSLFFDKTALDWHRKRNIFEKFDSLTLVCVSEWLQNRAMQSPMFKNRDFYVVGNGIDLNIYRPVNSENLRKKLGLKSEKIILHVTPSFKSIVKGGSHVLELAKRIEKENVKIIVVGFDGYNDKLPSNILTVQHTSSQEELAEFYSMADVTLLTSKLETFSMVTIESLCCGTPVVGYSAGAPEQIAVKEYSEFVENGDIAGLEKIVLKWLDKDITPQNVIKCVGEKYSTLNMVEAYKYIYHQLKAAK